MHGIPTAGCNPFSVFFGWFLVWLFVFGLFVLFWFVLPLRGLLTGLCIGPLPALLRLPTNLTALQANYNSAFLLRLNVCNDLAKAMKALDGKNSLHTAMHCRSFRDDDILKCPEQFCSLYVSRTYTKESYAA